MCHSGAMKKDLVAEALVERFDGASFGSIVVRAVTVAPILNSHGDDAYRVRLVVEDPKGRTWAVDDMTAVDLFANKVAYEAGGDDYVYVNLVPLSVAGLSAAS